MRCDEARELLPGYLDGELDLVRAVEVERHLADCGSCMRARGAHVALHEAVRDAAPYHRAPDRLHKRVRTAIRNAPAEDSAAERRPAPWFAIGGWVAAAAACVALVAVLALRPGPGGVGPAADDLVAREVLASHLRSLMAGHLADVMSSDQHTVKPWFAGKLDFSPPVVDLADRGFPLVGGRLDYLDGRPVAALVYRRRRHTINLFVWPSDRVPGTPGPSTTLQGYHVVHWTRSGMAYWAVSDLAGGELETFAREIQEQTRAGT